MIGGAVGIILGLLIEIVEYTWKNKDKWLRSIMINNKYSEVILIINCDQKDAQLVSKILKENLALSIAKVE